MKKKLLSVLLCVAMIGCMTIGCGKKEEVVTADPDAVISTEESVETEEVEELADEIMETESEEKETVEEVTENTDVELVADVMPLPTTINMTALDNCTLAVSFEEGDAYVDDTGAMQLDVTVYDYELFDMVDVSNLKEGDTIAIQGNVVTIETLEILESGLIFINGGMDNGGYDLWHDESGVYFEHGYNDAKAYYSLGEATIRVSADFEFVDASDLDKGETTYYPGDFLTDGAGIEYFFTPNNTKIVIEDGQIIGMTRIYTP